MTSVNDIKQQIDQNEDRLQLLKRRQALQGVNTKNLTLLNEIERIQGEILELQAQQDNEAGIDPTENSAAQSRIPDDQDKPKDQSTLYKVQPGDTLTAIARKVYGDPDQALLIKNANFSDGPISLHAGEELLIPPLLDADPTSPNNAKRGEAPTAEPTAQGAPDADSKLVTEAASSDNGIVEDDLPDWLQEVQQEVDETLTISDLLPTAEGVGEAEDDGGEKDKLPDWIREIEIEPEAEEFSQTTDADAEPGATGPTLETAVDKDGANELAAEEDLPDWLRDVEGDEVTPQPIEAAEEDLPDWLRDVEEDEATLQPTEAAEVAKPVLEAIPIDKLDKLLVEKDLPHQREVEEDSNKLPEPTIAEPKPEDDKVEQADESQPDEDGIGKITVDGGAEMERELDDGAETLSITQIVQLNNQPPPPPKAEYNLMIEVTAQTISLTYGDREPYKSPNLINHDTLEFDANYSSQSYGELLFEGIIHDQGSPNFTNRPTRRGYDLALAEVEQNGENLRIELRVAPDHPVYKWEYLRDPKQSTPLAVYEYSPFYRLYGASDQALVPVEQIKILFVICNPLNLGQAGHPILQSLMQLDLQLERNIIDEALAPLVETGVVAYDILSGSPDAPVTLTALKEKLQDGGYHIFHFIGHGVYLKPRSAHKPGKFALVMEGDDRQHNFVFADDFDEAMFGPDLRLVILSACQSGRTTQLEETGEALQAIGPALLEKKIPAVIAMQDNLPIRAAQIFTKRFYDDLARQGRIDMAMAATRYDLYFDDKASWTWGIPVLFMNQGNGKLFDVDKNQADQINRPASIQDMQLKDYQGLGVEDPSDQRLLKALEHQIELHGYSEGASLLNSINTAIVSEPINLPAVEQPEPMTQPAAAEQPAVTEEPTVAEQPTATEPIAPKQDREKLAALANPIGLQAEDLRHFVENSSGIKLPAFTFAQIVAALNAGKHIILIGPPGTGKTSLAQDICGYATANNFTTGPVLTTATADWTTFDTVGGYVPAQDQTLQFRPGIFLEAISEGRWLVIDEINRAEIDKAFGELFTVLSGQQVDLPYQVGSETVRVLPPTKMETDAPNSWIPAAAQSDYHYVMHPNWRIIGTMNVYDKASLFAMSFAFMRRFAFIDVDLPPGDLFVNLVQDWLKSCDLAPAVVIELHKKFSSMLGLGAQDPTDAIGSSLQKTPLMKRRALGPAIIKDMIEYIDNRYKSSEVSATSTLVALQLLGEAFLLYVVPQLDGLDHDGILKIYHYLDKDVFGELASEDKHYILTRIRALYPHIQPQEWQVETDV